MAALVRHCTLVCPEVIHCLACGAADVLVVSSRAVAYLWPLYGPDSPAPTLRLTGHRRPLTALAFQRGGAVLCTASRDCIALWDVERLLTAWQAWEQALSAEDEADMFEADVADGEFAAPLQFQTAIPADPTCLVFAPDSLLAVGLEATILLFSLDSLQPVMQLDGHTAAVTGMVFCAHVSGTLVSVSLDRTFKVWDLNTQQLTYQSAILTAAGISCVAEDPDRPRIALGFEDGAVRFFDAGPRAWPEAYVVDVHRCASRAPPLSSPPLEAPSPGITVVDGTRLGQPPQRPAASPAAPTAAPGRRHGVLGLHYLPRGTYGAVHPHGQLLVATPWAFLTVNTDSFEVAYLADLVAPDAETTPDAACHFAAVPVPFGARAVAGSAFQPVLSVFEVMDRDAVLRAGRPDWPPADDALTFLARRPLPRALLADLVPPAAKAAPSTAGRRAPTVNGSRTVKPPSAKLPVTFHSKVKSSGYNSGPPVMTLFGQKPTRRKSTGPSSSRPASAGPTYEDATIPPLYPQAKHTINALHNSPILALAYAGDGRCLASASQDCTACVVRHPARPGADRPKALQAHRQPVTSCCFSLDRTLLLTSSNDCTACLWLLTAPTHDRPNLVWNTRDGDAPLTAEVRSGRFFYMDRFVALAAGPAVYLYKYFVDRKVDDLNRHSNNSKYKVAQTINSGAQHVLALDCANTFYSNLVVFATSGKSIVVHDVAQNAAVRTYGDAHARPPQAICLPAPASGADPLAHNTFLSAAPDGAARLWDLRQAASVRTFSGHANRTARVGVALSPCLRYVATGSEDRCVYVYDLASGATLGRLHGHTDVVSDVAFNPVVCELASVSFDQRVRFWSPDKQP